MDRQDSPAAGDAGGTCAARRHPVAYRLAAAGALVVLVLTQHALVRGTRSPDNDALQFFGPYHLFTGIAARHGSLLLWNPLSNGGAPDYIEPQVGAISPAVLATAFMAGGAEWGFRLYWLLIWFAGGAGVIGLGRRLRAPAWGCFCAACGFMLSGFYVGHAQHTAMLASASYLPWVLWRADIALLERRSLAAAEAGVMLGLSGLGGYPGILVMNGMMTGLWLLGRMMTRDRPPSVRTLALTLAVLGATALAVLSPTYIAFVVEGRGFTYRTGPLPRWLAVENNSLLPWNIATLVGPAALFWQIVPAQDASMRSVYLGVVIVPLAIWALRRAEGGWRPWLAICAALFAAAALGSTLPVRGWLYDYFMPTRYFRHAALFREPAMLIVTVLAMLGSRDLAERSSQRTLRRLAALTAVVATGFLVLYGAIASAAPQPRNDAWPSTVLLWAAVPGVFLLASALRTPARALRAAAIGLVTIAALDAANAAHISAPQVYGPHITAWRRLDRLRQMATSKARLLDREEVNLFNFNLISGTPVLKSYAPLASPLHEAFVSDPKLRQMALGPNRFWFVSAPPAVALTEGLMPALSAAAQRGSRGVFVHAPRSMRLGIQPASGPLPDPASATLVQPFFTAYDQTRVDMEVTAPEAGWLIVTDRWARGWQATVNGVRTPIWGANGIWRAVRVSAGRNTIAMRYRPFGYPWLLALSWGVVGLVLVFTVVSHRRSAGGRAIAIPAAMNIASAPGDGS